MKRRIQASVLVMIAFIILMGSAYINTYYRATEEALNVIDMLEKEEEDVLVFEPKSKARAGLIFYPGGKVEYTAYAPLMKACADEGIVCVLLKMPCNLAVLNINAAKGLQEKYSEITEWYMAGHSLGGSMAACYIKEHVTEFEGLILLGSYSTEDLSTTELKVLSIYGTEDQVLNKEKYIEYEENLPMNYEELIIDGGCHAYFGNYGEQEGDGEAKITVEEQQKITVNAIKKTIEKK